MFASSPRPFGAALEIASERASVRLRGELDLATVTNLVEALKAAEDSGASQLLIDLRDLEFIDSSGVTELLRAKARATDNGHRIQYLWKPGPIEKTLQSMGVSSLLPLAA